MTRIGVGVLLVGLALAQAALGAPVARPSAARPVGGGPVAGARATAVRTGTRAKPGASANAVGAPSGSAPSSQNSAAPLGAKLPDASAASSAELASSKTTKDGVTTYQFKALELEGRLSSPQILFFVRRLRAELGAKPLGHRSFMPELRTTQHSPALR